MDLQERLKKMQEESKENKPVTEKKSVFNANSPIMQRIKANIERAKAEGRL